MPLFDHFHAPLSQRRHWQSFHNSWASSISADMNRSLPTGWFAEANVHFGIEIDVAALDERPTETAPDGGKVQTWAPPAPTQTLPLPLLTDLVEVQVFSASGGPTLAGAIELVSPANKDRGEHRDAFVTRCASYLQQGIGLIVVDVVTERRANLHAALLERLASPGLSRVTSALYAVAYRPVRREDQAQFDTWEASLAIGQALPTLPLWLRGGITLPVDLESSYERTRREQRIPDVA